MIQLYDQVKRCNSLNFLLQGSLKEFDKQKLLPVVLGIVEDRQDDILHEAVRLALRHLKDKFGKVVRMGL